MNGYPRIWSTLARTSSAALSGLRACSGVFAALLLLLPCSLVRGGDGVGTDGLIGSLPQRRGPNGECLFQGLAASFVPAAGSFWSSMPGASGLLAFEGPEAEIRGSISAVRREAGRTRVRLTEEAIALAFGCDVDMSVDFQRLANAGANTYLQLPSSYVATFVSAASSSGVILSEGVAANARHFYLNLGFIVRTMGQYWLPDVELYFVDPQARLLRARFSLEAGSLVRIQVTSS
ncbi:MAG: hypothetical protein JNM84_20325 [Planctomycetes bacterium]|nr:hypothetical protein [Planctomycetota bacterium]